MLIMCVAVLLMCSMVLCGCSDNSDGPSKKQISQNGDAAYFADMPTELIGTTVTFATWIDHSTTDTGKVLSGFEETTGMKYQMVQVNQADYITKIMSLIASDQSPDVIVDNGEFPRTLSLLQPLSKDTNTLDPTDPFWDQQIVKDYTIDGKTYLVNGAKSTWKIGGAMTYYNKNMLQENGIKTPSEYVEENNWNIDTFMTLANQISQVNASTNAGVSISFTDWLGAFGGAQIEWDSTNSKFVNSLNKPESEKAMKVLMEAKDKGIVRILYSTWDDTFKDGNTAVTISGAYGLRKNPGWFYDMDLDDLGFTYFPKINKEDEKYPTTTTLRSYGIAKGAKNAQGAAYFLRYFLNQDNYDVDNLFKNEEAKALYFKLRDECEIKSPCYAYGVNRITNPGYTGTTPLVSDIVSGTSNQLSVNISKSLNKVNSAVESANVIIDQCIKDNK